MESPLLTDATWIFDALTGVPSVDEMHIGAYSGFGPGTRDELENAHVLSGFYNACVKTLDHQLLDGLTGLQHLAMSVHLGDFDFKGRKTIFFKFSGSNDRFSKVDFFWHLPDFNVLPASNAYGVPFSEKVYNKLKVEGYFCHIHRGYCGIGLFYREGSIKIGEVDEGELLTTLMIFTDKDEFVNFFSMQSDLKMSRCDRSNSLYTSDPKYQSNQTLDKNSLNKWLAESSEFQNISEST